MEDIPRNLQIIKTEQTTTDQYTNNIKERLNLHVKRRLLQEAHQTPKIMSDGGALLASTITTAAATTSPALLNASTNDTQLSEGGTTVRLNQKQQQMKETPKTRRPYQRRADKANMKNATIITTTTTTTSTVTATILTSTTPPSLESPIPVRKRRQKTKTQQNIATNSLSVINETNLAAIVRSEDDGSHDGIHEMEARTPNTRDKKCPDILGMVLSMKRRALLQDPEVHEFLHKIMGAIKS